MDTVKSEAPLTKNQKQWLAHIRAASENNLPLATYAKQNNIDPNKLYSWKSQLKQKGLLSGSEPSSSFVKVKVTPSVTIDLDRRLRIILKNGIQIEIIGEGNSLLSVVKELSSANALSLMCF